MDRKAIFCWSCCLVYDGNLFNSCPHCDENKRNEIEALDQAIRMYHPDLKRAFAGEIYTKFKELLN